MQYSSRLFPDFLCLLSDVVPLKLMWSRTSNTLTKISACALTVTLCDVTERTASRLVSTPAERSFQPQASIAKKHLFYKNGVFLRGRHGLNMLFAANLGIFLILTG